jgi:hypothetical protein
MSLALLPFRSRYLDIQFSHEILDARGLPYELCNELMNLEKEVGFPVSDSFTSYLSRDDAYEEPHYGETSETPYGKQLMYLHARHVKQVLKKAEEYYPEDFGHPMGYGLRAVTAYVNELPDDLPIALYWH